MSEFARVRYDVIGLSETKRRDSLVTEWENGDHIFLGSRFPNSTSAGVGFVVSKSISSRIIDVVHLSPRVAKLRLKARGTSISIIQVYAPTADSDQEDHELFYDDVQTALRGDTSLYRVLMGDFNATIGSRLDASEVYIGHHSCDTRNPSGEQLASFLDVNRLFHVNSQFYKRDDHRWTHRSPDGNHKREIDHIMTNVKGSFTNLETLRELRDVSDHRPIRGTLVISNSLIRRAKVPKPPRRTFITNADSLAADPRLSDLIPAYIGDFSSEYSEFTTKLQAILADHRRPAATHATTRIGTNTKELLNQRRQMKSDPTRDPVLFAALSKKCRRGIKADHEDYTTSRLLAAAERRQSLKTTTRKLQQHHLLIPCIKDASGTRLTARHQIEAEFTRFYTSLYKSSHPTAFFQLRPTTPLDQVPFILPSEVRSAIHSSPSGKSPGLDKISIDELKGAGHELHVALAERFSAYLSSGSIPSDWKSSAMTIIYKKGDKESIGNYRPITNLPTLYKIFSKVLLGRIRRTLDSNQPLEQAGFRPGFNTSDNIQTTTRVIEAAREHKMPLVLTFVDYQKAFDTVEVPSILEALESQGIHPQYLKIISECLTNTSTTIRLFDRKLVIPIERGARQGDPMSPSLFNAVLEHAMRPLNWTRDDTTTPPTLGRGIDIDGRQLHHLRFADDLVIFSNSLEEAQESLNELNTRGREVGLEMNLSKTKYMTANIETRPNHHIKIGTTTIQEVDHYIYLGRSLNMQNEMHHELHRRRSAGWATISNIMPVISSSTDRNLKSNLFNTHVLPAITYASETWTLTAASERHLKVTQAALERKLVGISLREQRDRLLHNSDIRVLSGAKDAVTYADHAKHRWAGHVMRRTDNRWCRATMEWYPRTHPRPRGRPPIRWSDSLAHRNNKHTLIFNRISRTVTKKFTYWSTIAQDRETWKKNWVPQKSNRPLRNGATK